MDNKIHNRKYLKERRKELRNNLTSAEAVLWNALKNKQLMGRKFRRQHSIENYIVDFYCPAEKLIIELDGQFHFDPVQRVNDSIRQQRLHELGFTIVRFENEQVFSRIDTVLAGIATCFSPDNI